MRAVKRPIPIEVVQFAGMGYVPPGVRVAERMDSAKPDETPTPAFRVWNAKHESWIGFNVGDFLNVTDLGDVYPIARDVFEQTYDLLPRLRLEGAEVQS